MSEPTVIHGPNAMQRRMPVTKAPIRMDKAAETMVTYDVPSATKEIGTPRV
jgi:hypothetical protein